MTSNNKAALLPLAGPIPPPELDKVYQGKMAGKSKGLVVDENKEWPYLENGEMTSAFQRNETIYRAIWKRGDGTYLMCISRDKDLAVERVSPHV